MVGKCEKVFGKAQAESQGVYCPGFIDQTNKQTNTQSGCKITSNKIFVSLSLFPHFFLRKLYSHPIVFSPSQFGSGLIFWSLCGLSSSHFSLLTIYGVETIVCLKNTVSFAVPEV